MSTVRQPLYALFMMVVRPSTAATSSLPAPVIDNVPGHPSARTGWTFWGHGIVAGFIAALVLACAMRVAHRRCVTSRHLLRLHVTAGNLHQKRSHAPLGFLLAPGGTPLVQ